MTTPTERITMTPEQAAERAQFVSNEIKAAAMRVADVYPILDRANLERNASGLLDDAKLLSAAMSAVTAVAESRNAEIAALREKLAWRPIAEAPKDGTPVLLVWHWRTDIPGHNGVAVVLDRWTCRAHSHLSRHHDCPNEPDCKMGWGYAGEMTHWLPRPEPPAIESALGKGGGES